MEDTFQQMIDELLNNQYVYNENYLYAELYRVRLFFADWLEEQRDNRWFGQQWMAKYNKYPGKYPGIKFPNYLSRTQKTWRFYVAFHWLRLEGHDKIPAMFLPDDYQQWIKGNSSSWYHGIERKTRIECENILCELLWEKRCFMLRIQGAFETQNLESDVWKSFSAILTEPEK